MSQQNLFTIGLAGTPNVGKSTIFNALTKMHQHTGNWSGKTVACCSGQFHYKDMSCLIVDLPGTYSLRTHSEEEEIAREYIVSGEPDLLLVVCDATCPERGLRLLKQIRDLEDSLLSRVILCVNLCDEAAKKGIVLNFDLLSKELNIPVIPCTARDRHGLDKLKEEIYSACLEAACLSPDKRGCAEKGIGECLCPSFFQMCGCCGHTDSGKEENQPVFPASCNGCPCCLCSGIGTGIDAGTDTGTSADKAAGTNASTDADTNAGTDTGTSAGTDTGATTDTDGLELYTYAGANRNTVPGKSRESDLPNFSNFAKDSRFAAKKDILKTLIPDFSPADLTAQAVTYKNPAYLKRQERIDRLITGRFTGSLIMIALLLGIFWLTITGANYPSSLLWDQLFKLETWLAAALTGIGAPVWVVNSLVYGVFRVVAWVVSVMLPPMAIFFPLFTLLEDLGYLPRAAFNMDCAFKKCKACGKQCLTMCIVIAGICSSSCCLNCHGI